MKRLLIVIIILLVVVGCSNNKENENEEKIIKSIKKQIENQHNESTNKTNELNEVVLEITEDGNVKEEIQQENNNNILIKNSFGEYLEVPVLSSIASSINDFVPNGWKIIDSIELDFDRDKLLDVVGVLEIEEADSNESKILEYPRILFAIRNTGDNCYELSFQDINLIRNSSEGGAFGDPYLPLTSNGYIFETNAFGGSSSKWSEKFAYEYINNEWYLVEEETTFNYGPYITDYIHNDYHSGIGIRNYNSDVFEIIEQRDGNYEPFDLNFEISLDEPYKLQEFSAKWFLAEDRLVEMVINEVNILDSVNLTESRIDDIKIAAQKMNEIKYIDYENIVYTFKNEEENQEFLAVYQRNDKETKVLIKAEISKNDIDSNYSDVEIYKDKLFYSHKFNDKLIELYAINLDDFDIKKIAKFEKTTDKEGLQSFNIGYEIHNEKIVYYIYTGKDKTYYIMNLDGSNMEKIGKIESGL